MHSDVAGDADFQVLPLLAVLHIFLILHMLCGTCNTVGVAGNAISNDAIEINGTAKSYSTVDAEGISSLSSTADIIRVTTIGEMNIADKATLKR